MILYKFFHPDALKKRYFGDFLFMNIHCREPHKFNDSWDANIFFESANDQFIIEKLGEDAFPSGHFKYGVTSSVIAAIKKHPEKTLIEDTCFPQNTTARVCYELASNIAIGCLTSKWDDPLMWGHYSNGHLGFCVGVGIDDSDIGKYFHRVKYSNTTPYKIPYSVLTQESSRFFKHLINEQLVTKSLNWSYEEEYRLIVPSERHVSAKLYVDKLSDHIQLHPSYNLPRVKLKEMTFGAKCKIETELLQEVKHFFCAHATSLVNSDAGRHLKQDQVDNIIKESLLQFEIFKTSGIESDYSLIRKKLVFPKDLLHCPLLPLPKQDPNSKGTSA